MARILALDHGSARCGCAISDPSGTLATPLPVVERPGHASAASRRSRGWWRSRGRSAWWWGSRSPSAVTRAHQAGEARTFAERLERRVSVPVELHDERLTTRLAERTGGAGDADSRAAAHLLESYWPAVERAPPSEPRTAARSGRPLARGAGGRAPGARGAPSRARGQSAPAPPPPRSRLAWSRRSPCRRSHAARRADPSATLRAERAVTSEHAVATAPDEPAPTRHARGAVPRRRRARARLARRAPGASPAMAAAGGRPRHGRAARGRRGPGRLIALGVLVLILLGIGLVRSSRCSSRSRATASGAGAGNDPAGLEPLADRRPPRAERRDRRRRLLPAARADHRPQRRPPAGHATSCART